MASTRSGKVRAEGYREPSAFDEPGPDQPESRVGLQRRHAGSSRRRRPSFEIGIADEEIAAPAAGFGMAAPRLAARP